MGAQTSRGRLLRIGLTGMATAAAAWGIHRSGQWRLLRMTGTSIAAPSAAGWFTDFLNAAYYRRNPAERHVDDLRLAFAVLTTRWHRLGCRRLRGPDVWAFHRAFFRQRLQQHEAGSPRGTLTREQLLAGAARLLGPWFPAAYADPARRGWGVVFEDAAERAAYQPEVRLLHGGLGPLAPPTAAPAEQVWHTYPPVPVRSAEAAAAALTQPETWPDYASEIGRFTPVRRGGLGEQTFEIEVIGRPLEPTPLLLRAYVTATRVVTRRDAGALGAYVEELNEHMRRFGRDEPAPVPERAEPVLALDLTSHVGHFLGKARNRLLVYVEDGRAYLRAAGTWDPLDWPLEQMYERVGRYAQHAFWGMDRAEESMLHQIAAAVERAGRA